MTSFSDLVADGTVNERIDGFINCNRVSIESVVNKPIEVLGYVADVETKQGKGRMIVHFRDSGSGGEGKFFTNCKTIKEIIKQIPPEKMPFTTTIVSYRDGNAKGYKFT